MWRTSGVCLLLLVLAEGQKIINDDNPVHVGVREDIVKGLSQRESKGNDAASSRQFHKQTRKKHTEEQNASSQEEQNSTEVTPEPVRGQEQNASTQEQKATQVMPEEVQGQNKSWIHPKRQAAQLKVEQERSAWRQSANSSWATIQKLRTIVAHLKAGMTNHTRIADLADSIVSKALEPFQERQGHLQRDFSAKLDEALNNTEPGKENVSAAKAAIECALKDSKQLTKLERIELEAVKSSLRKSKREAKSRAKALQKEAKHAARHSKHLGSVLEKAQRKAGVKEHEYEHERDRTEKKSEWLQDQAEQAGEHADDLIEEQFDAIEDKVEDLIHRLRSLSKRKRVQREQRLRQAMLAIKEARVAVQKTPVADNQTAIDQNKSSNQTATGQSRPTRHMTDKHAVVKQGRTHKKTDAGEDRPDNQLSSEKQKMAIDQGSANTHTAASRSRPDREGADDPVSTGQSKGSVVGKYAQEPAVFLAGRTSSSNGTTLVGPLACLAVVVTLALVVQLRQAQSRHVHMASYPALG